MKKCLLVAAVSGTLLLFSGSCKKSQPASNYSVGIAGSWELRYTEGGLRASGTPMPDQHHILSFTDTEYGVSSGGQLTDSGRYTLVQDNGVREATCNPSLQADQFEKLTLIHSSYSVDSYIKISGNVLEIYSGCVAADGIYAKYERLPVRLSLQLQ